MNEEPAGHRTPTSEPTSHPDEAGPRDQWRAPVISHLSVEQTLFQRGSPCDGGSFDGGATTSGGGMCT